MSSQGNSPQGGSPTHVSREVRGLRDPNCPKSIKFTYEFYYKENPPPNYIYMEQRFDRLPDEQKAKYKQMEQQDRERYRQETANYKISSGWIDNKRTMGEYEYVKTIDWYKGYLPQSRILHPMMREDGVQKKQKVASNDNNQEHQPAWSDLNAEIISDIASFMEHPRDAFSMCYTCSNWYKSLSDPEGVAQEAVWMPLAISRFPQLFHQPCTRDDGYGEITFVLKRSHFTYRDTFIVHDRIVSLDHNAELSYPDKSNQIREEGLTSKDFILSFVLTHYSTRDQRAEQYAFGMATLGEMEQYTYVPNFHDMLLATDYMSDFNLNPCPDDSTISVMRCFLTGPGYKTVMIFKFTDFDAEWGGEGYYYCGYTFHNDQNNALLDLGISGRAEGDYRPDDLCFNFEGSSELIDLFTQMFRGQDPNSVAA